MATPLVGEDLFAFRLGGAVQALADGRILYLESRLDRKDNTAHSQVMAIGPGRKVTPFTRGPHDTSPQLSLDGQWLAFLARQEESVQLWVMPTAGGEARQVSDLRGGVRSYAWAPDCRSFALISEVRHGRLETATAAAKTDRERHTADVRLASRAFYKLDGEGLFGPGQTQIIHQPLNGRPRLLTDWRQRIEQVAFAADGRSLWFISQGLDLPAADWAELWQLELGPAGRPRLVAGDASWSVGFVLPAPQGPDLLVVASDPRELGYGNDQLFRIRPDGSRQPLLSGLDRPVGNLASSDLVPPSGPAVIWPPGRPAPYALISEDGRVDVVEVPLDGGPGRIVTAGDHTVHAMAAHPQGLVIARATAAEPSEIVLLAGGRERVLLGLNRALLRRHPPVLPTRFQAQAPGGPVLDAWALVPPQASAGRLPAILAIHGGPMMMYTRTYSFEFQLLAALGVAVIATNPRGSQGYGAAFCRAIRQEWGVHDQADLLAAVDAALSRFPAIDSQRLGVAGGSYGGFMTAWLIGHSDRFRAAHAARSVTDWRQMAGSGDVYWYWHERLGGRPWSEAPAFSQQSPLTYVESVRTPVLIEHQENDQRCPIGQGESFYAALKALGRTAVLVRYPGESHGMTRGGRPWHRVHRLDLLADWWRHFLLAEPAPSLAGHLDEAAAPLSGS